MSDVLFEKRPDGVGLITLNRPESMNAMGGVLMPTLGQYLAECEKDPEVRCVALTGAGRGFCAGGDVKGMQSRNSGQDGGGERPDVVGMLERGVREPAKPRPRRPSSFTR
jgi:2-(1,2-epoxy-1,2-dihydrophenyl)acetyl-CoA isomerase